MFANWPVLINGTIILLFVNDADHMFISTQESLTFTAPQDQHSIALALQCYLSESHSLTCMV